MSVSLIPSVICPNLKRAPWFHLALIMGSRWHIISCCSIDAPVLRSTMELAHGVHRAALWENVLNFWRMRALSAIWRKLCRTWDRVIAPSARRHSRVLGRFPAPCDISLVNVSSFRAWGLASGSTLGALATLPTLRMTAGRRSTTGGTLVSGRHILSGHCSDIGGTLGSGCFNLGSFSAGAADSYPLLLVYRVKIL